ncbi:hypothetical protein KAM546c_01300 [Enterobacter roggenkampii]|nr:hypothetical protein KAM546c_01300 [Enterobacter roggenkampii]
MGWADIGTGGVLALMATHRRSLGVPLHHPQARGKSLCGEVILMRDRTGHFTGAAPDAFFRIRHYKSVHLLRLAYVKTQLF